MSSTIKGCLCARVPASNVKRCDRDGRCRGLFWQFLPQRRVPPGKGEEPPDRTRGARIMKSAVFGSVDSQWSMHCLSSRSEGYLDPRRNLVDEKMACQVCRSRFRQYSIPSAPLLYSVFHHDPPLTRLPLKDGAWRFREGVTSLFREASATRFDMYARCLNLFWAWWAKV